MGFRLSFLELTKKRRSIHYFTDEEVSEEDLDYILEAARWAPSAGNSQPWRFIVVRNSDNRLKVWESTTSIEFKASSRRTIPVNPQNFIRKAPVHIVVCTDTKSYKGKQSRINADLYCIQDSAAAIMNLLLAVCDRGLGACWVGMFREEALRETFNIPPHLKPVAIIPVGHTKSKEKPRPRRPLEEIVLHETF